MKRNFILSLVVLILSSCSDDDLDTKTIENLSGVTWYKTTVFVSDTEKGELEIVTDGFSTVEIGESIKVKTNAGYFSISAYNSKGKLISSYSKPFSGSTGKITAKDIF